MAQFVGEQAGRSCRIPVEIMAVLDKSQRTELAKQLGMNPMEDVQGAITIPSNTPPMPLVRLRLLLETLESE
jgi:hypothetical protein